MVNVKLSTLRYTGVPDHAYVIITTLDRGATEQLQRDSVLRDRGTHLRRARLKAINASSVVVEDRGTDRIVPAQPDTRVIIETDPEPVT